MRPRTFVFASLALLLLLPAGLSAQTATSGSIAGVVRDATGAVLPGVTVEVASPALIERIRTAFTDDQGNYKVLDLRPGIYAVTFTLEGFGVVKRDGIELTTGFTAVVNADLKVGAIQETMTVSGVSPVVDTQNTNTQKVLSRAVLESVPTNNAVQGFAAVIPGAILSGASSNVDVGGSMGDISVTFGIHGAKGLDMRSLMDGMSYAASIGTGGGTSRWYTPNPAAAEEVVIQTSGVSAEGETGGVQVNMVPREGGNAYKGIFEASFTNDAMQGSNLTDELKSRGLVTPLSIEKIYALRGGIGGPIKKDKLWFYTSHGFWVSQQQNAGNWYNKTPQTLFYEPDYARPATIRYPVREDGVRITWQATQKHKITGLYSREKTAQDPFFGLDGQTIRPEAAIVMTYSPLSVSQATWTYPATSRFLLQAGASYSYNNTNNTHYTGGASIDRAIVDQSDGYSYGAPGAGDNKQNASHFDTRFAASYVTGSHAIKVGGTTITGHWDTIPAPRLSETYTFNNRAPTSLTQVANPIPTFAKLNLNMGLYVQDQWTLRRLTLNLGLRFDSFHTSSPEQTQPAGTYVARTHFDKFDIFNYKDINPRLGASYDLFGNGKTALKVSLGRYVGAESLGISVGIVGPATLVTSANRTWNDNFFPVGDPRRGNYVPDCVLTNPSANDECGALSNPALGLENAVRTRWSDDVTRGWNARFYNWQTSASLQHELRPGMAVNFGYFRTWYNNFGANRAGDRREGGARIDDLNLTPQDYDPFCITAPVDPRLPGGGGNQVCGFYDIKPTKFGQPVNNLVRPASDFGKQTEVYNGIDATVTARFGHGGLLNGGLSAGRFVTDECFVVDSPQQLNFCHIAPPWSYQTQVKVNGYYPLPWDLQAAVTLQNVGGAVRLASYVATNAQVAPSLNRNLGSCRGAAVCNATVVLPNLYAPYSQFEPRRNQLDLRLTKFVRLGRYRVRGNFDLYNVFNADDVIASNPRYSPTNSWLLPQSVMPARLFKVGAQFDF